MITEADITAALRACYSYAPGHQPPVNIVDLGLIHAITLTPDPEAPGAGIPGVPQKHTLTLTLLFPSADETLQSHLHYQIANCLAGIPQLSRTTITFTPSPPWTPSRLTPAARQFLQLDFPILR